MEARTSKVPLVVFFNADRATVEPWFEAFGRPELTVALDPRAELYDALGTVRLDYVTIARRSVGGAIRALREGLVPRPTRADMQRQGADVAVRADGEIALLHLAQSPDDRRPPEELLRMALP